MNRHILCLPLLAMLLLVLPSCGDINYWNPEPPNGWDNTFYDNNLTGCWQLYQVDSDYVRGDEVNYMQFLGDGRGWYYYYSRGYQEAEKLAYWCQRSVNATSSLQINIDYEYSNPSTMNYWFSDSDTLWMQWRTYDGAVHTYVYKYYGRTAPW